MIVLKVNLNYMNNNQSWPQLEEKRSGEKRYFSFVDTDKWSETYDYIRNEPWTLENEVLLSIVNLSFAEHKINLQK